MAGAKDRWFWNFTANEQYSMKSGYIPAKERVQRKTKENRRYGNTSYCLENSEVWKLLWVLNMKHRIKHFVWKSLNQILPVNEVIFRRIDKRDPVCQRCGNSG
ncbi:hypothetical protein ACH5RR_013566 [Cinchona calisaya]|uniref:Reverse transcriptase zinc-binding domain-containing protein n=1 Tax=Cinchona calisaya TaxID=153742 RepID=A0ABD3A0D0_9GENT